MSSILCLVFWQIDYQSSFFSARSDSQEYHLPTDHDEGLEVGSDSDESEPSQPSFKRPSEVFQAFSLRTFCGHLISQFSAVANTQAIERLDTLFDFSPT